MSSTPVFDATLADAPVNIWQASSIFPHPDSFLSCATADPRYFAKVTAVFPETDYTDWSAINMGNVA